MLHRAALRSIVRHHEGNRGPDRPLHLIIPYAVGGTTEVIGGTRRWLHVCHDTVERSNQSWAKLLKHIRFEKL
ncbi:hypothetical protein [Diaphorobacter aerolatus]|uniref:Uncharacterized protein n=1 Tax=Diaphorobacter aerolatus TaxID=1288495 RepID=A0A7H0GI23_9BURK|nr:hypothetical protein [Diaphorobacter aerolatus]QNP47939.1 hypothetical protein H9K75_17745 [Diaphorobacter aerolatus]